jgi:uncharacterized protein YkwD
MKHSHQFAILVFLCIALFVVRDDVAVAYKRVMSYISPRVASIVLPVNNAKESIVISSDKVSDLLNSKNTPGALKVTEGLVSNTNDVRLTVKDVINSTNANRALNGDLTPLKENSKLDISAQMKLNDMFKQQYFEHVSPDKVGVSDLGDRVDYEYIIIGENLALGNFKNASALLDAWMASPGHRENILNNRYSEIGAAVGQGVYNGQTTWMAVQHFGLPRSACPAIDEVIKGIITLDQKQIKMTGENLAMRQSKIESGVVYEGLTVNEQIAKYNEIVVSYNKLIQDVKEKISQYNSTVRAFNNCLSKNTN